MPLSGYEVFVQPVLFVGLILTVIGMLVRGINNTRTTLEVDGIDVSVRKWGYSPKALLKAGGVLGVVPKINSVIFDILKAG